MTCVSYHCHSISSTPDFHRVILPTLTMPEPMITTFVTRELHAIVTNTTASCPTFFGSLVNATVPCCSLRSCASTTAVRAECCPGSQVFPYHSSTVWRTGFPRHRQRQRLKRALVPGREQLDGGVDRVCCLSGAQPRGRMLGFFAGQKGLGEPRAGARVKTTVVLAIVVGLFHSMLGYSSSRTAQIRIPSQLPAQKIRGLEQH